jgi:lysophospholipase L1-like esterase
MKDDLNIMRWAVLGVVVISIFVIYSVWNMGSENKAKLQENAKKDSVALAESKEAEFLNAQKAAELNPVDTTRQHILFIGDSMAEGLKYSFQQYSLHNRHQLTVIAKTSAGIVSWVGRDSLGKLRNTIEQIKPSYVIICLGSNELFTKYLDQYGKYLDNVVNQLGSTKFIWICPPNWKDDLGLTDLIARKVGEKRFFPSKKMKIPRAGDGIHPTFEGYGHWADSIAHWLMYDAAYKIQMEKMPEKGDKATIQAENTK